MKKSAILISALFLVSLAPAFARELPDAKDGARLFKRKGCYTCHGQNGANPIGPQYPVLAGQNTGYIVEQIKAFSGGHRSVLPYDSAKAGQNRSYGVLNSNQMVPFANSIYKEGEVVVNSIATYLNSQTQANHNSVDSALAEQGKTLFAERGCNACHGEEGKAPIMDQYPKLAGLSPKYITNQLDAFRKGTRVGTEFSNTMAPMASTLTEEESEAVANYLGSFR
jgi:cytochrome c553